MNELKRTREKGLLLRLIRHFCVLRLVERLLEPPYQSKHPIEYIDCNSTGTWRELNSYLHQEETWVADRLGRFVENGGDLIARAFFSAWGKHHTKRDRAEMIVPDIPRSAYERSFPDTALLLAAAFPTQLFRMRLHADNSQHRDELTQWAKDYGPELVRVAGDWTQSALLYQRAASLYRSTIVIVDSKKVVSGSTFRANSDNTMSEGLIRYLIGPEALALTSPAKRLAPCAVILLSEPVGATDETDSLISSIFAERDWTVEILPVERKCEIRLLPQPRAWIASRGFTGSILGESIADAWNEWWGELN